MTLFHSLVSPGAILFLLNAAVAAILAASICVIAATALRRSTAPLRHGILLCGLALVLLAPATALVAERAHLGWLEFGMEDFSHENAPQPAFSENGKFDSPPKSSHNVFPRNLSNEFAVGPDFSVEDPNEINEAPDLSGADSPIIAPIDSVTKSDGGEANALRSSFGLLAILWAAGSAIGLLLLVKSLVRLAIFRRTMKKKVSQSVQRVADQVAEQLGLPRRLPVFLSKRTVAPVTFGLLRPAIILPDNLAGKLTTAQLEGVLVHEMAHIKRRDALVGLAQRLAAALFWWCPLVHLLNRRLTSIREDICDSYVIRSQGDGAGFAALLVDLAEHMVMKHRLPATIGLFETSQRDLERRVKRLLARETSTVTRVSRKSRGILACFGMLLGAAILLVSVRAAEIQNADERSAQKPRANDVRVTARFDRYGDPLPKWALARLGTIRLRHAGLVLSVSYSPDGKMLASAATDNVVRLWNSADGRLLLELPGHNGLHSAQFSADGKVVVSCDRRSVRFWDAKTGKLKKHIADDVKTLRLGIQSFAISRKGDHVATGTQKSVTLWNVETGRPIRRWAKPTTEWSNSLAFSPDGKMLALASDAVYVWGIDTAKQLWRLPITNVAVNRGDSNGTERNAARAVTFAPDGKSLLAGLTGGNVCLWNVSSGARLRVMKLHTASVTSVAFSHDGKIIGTGSHDQSVGLWNAATGERIKSLNFARINNAFPVFSVSFSPNGKMLATAAANRIWLKDTRRGVEQTQHWFEGESVGQKALSFAPGDKTIATVTRDSCKTWLTTNGRHQSTVTIAPGGNAGCEFLPDGTLLTTSVHDSGSIPLGFFNPPKDGDARLEVRFRVDRLERLSVLPKEKRIAVSTADRKFGFKKRLTLLEFSGRKVREVDLDVGRATAIDGVFVSPDGKFAAAMLNPIRVTGEEQTAPVRVWNLKTGKRLFDCITADAAGSQIVFTADSKQLAAATFNFERKSSRITVWELATGKRIRVIDIPGIVISLAVTADQQFTAAGLRDGSIRVCNLRNGEQIIRLTGHRGRVSNLAFSSDGRRLASCSADTTGLVWDMTSLRQIADRPPANQNLKGSNRNTGKKLSITVEPTKKRFGARDRLYFRVVYKNISPRPLLIYDLSVMRKSYFGFLNVDTGQKWRYTHDPAIPTGSLDPAQSIVTKLDPGVVLRLTFERTLSTRFAMVGKDGALDQNSLVKHLPPGRYRTILRRRFVQGRAHVFDAKSGTTGRVPTKSNFHETVESEPARFAVVPGRGDPMVAWGPARNGIRLGLSTASRVVSRNDRSFKVVVWYWNVGKTPQIVPDHSKANSTFLMFSGMTYTGRPGANGKRFYVSYVIPRTETLLPRKRRLKPNEKFSETFKINFGSGTRFLGPPLDPLVKTLSLQAGLRFAWRKPVQIDPEGAKAWHGKDMLKSGSIGITRVVNVAAAPVRGLRHPAARKAIVDACAQIRLLYRDEKPGTYHSAVDSQKTVQIERIWKNTAVRNFLRDKSISDAAKIDRLWRWIVRRAPKNSERDFAVKFVQKAKDREAAFLDVLWTLTNTREFLNTDLRTSQGVWNVVRHKTNGLGFGKQDGTGSPLGPQVLISGDKITLQINTSGDKFE